MLVRRVAALSVAAALLCAPASRLAAMDVPDRTVPAAAGPLVPVSTELSYAAFPNAAVDATGRTWVAYSSSAGHVSATSDVRLRFADAGRTWSLPTVLDAGSGGYGVQTGGMATETLAQGGRLWVGTVRYQPTGAATATNYTSSVRYRDPTTGTWSTPLALPAISATQTIVTGLIVRPGGAVLAAAYGLPAGASYQVARLYAYDPSTSTWGVVSTVTISGRHAQEPTLVNLADGRLMMLIRSDATAPYYCRIYGVISSDDGATWGAPVLLVVHGSGMPTGYVLPSGEIAVAYRGFSSPVNPPADYPPRLTMLAADGTPTGEHLDVLGVHGRYLYGVITHSIDGDHWVYAVEAPDGQTGGGAQVFEVPLRWEVRS